MAKRTDEELDDHIMELFEYRMWSPQYAQRILSKNGSYDPPDEADMLGSVDRLLAASRIQLSHDDGDTEMQSVYVTTEPLPGMDSEPEPE